MSDRQAAQGGHDGQWHYDTDGVPLEYLGMVGVDLDGDFLSQSRQLLTQLTIEVEPE
ncbi:MAG: hypothetical protein AB1543_08120 [Candidatus Bipolaricaulota bacterium]